MVLMLLQISFMTNHEINDYCDTNRYEITFVCYLLTAFHPFDQIMFQYFKMSADRECKDHHSKNKCLYNKTQENT